MVRTVGRRYAAFVLLLIAVAGAKAAPIAIKRDTRIESDAGVVSVTTFRNVLYASSDSGGIYRWTGVQWQALPALPKRGEEFDGADIRLRVIDGRLIAVAEHMWGSVVHEWTDATSWRQTGYVEAHEEIYDVVRTTGGLFALSNRAVRRLDDKRGKWSVVWEGPSFGLDRAHTVVVGDKLYIVRKVPASEEPKKTEILRLESNVATDSKPAAERMVAKRIATFDGVVYSTAAVGDAIYITFYKIEGSSYSASDRIIRWRNNMATPIRSPGGEVYGLVTLEGQLYANASTGCYRLAGDRWVREGDVHVVELTRFNGQLVAATPHGVRIHRGKAWHALGTIEGTVNGIATDRRTTYYATHRDIFAAAEKASVAKATHVSIQEDVFFREAAREADYKACTDIVVLPEGQYAICKADLWFHPLNGAWINLSEIPAFVGKDEEVLNLFVDRGTLYCGTAFNVYRARGQTLEPIGILGRKARVVVARDTVFAGTDNGMFVYDDQTNTWRSIADGLLNVSVTAASPPLASGTFYLGTSTGQIWRVPAGTTQAELVCERFESADRPAIRSLWARPSQVAGLSDVLVAGTTRGLYWSNDGGAKWTYEEGIREVNQIVSVAPGKLAVAGLGGAYHVDEDIPAQLLPRIVAAVKTATRDWWWVSVIVIAIALIFPTILTLKVVALLPEKAQKAYYFSLFISPLARRQLVSRYVKYVKSARVVPSLGSMITLDEAKRRYVTLPSEGTSGEDLLVALEQSMLDRQTVWLRAGAGLGKSLAVWQLAARLIELKRVPIVLEGYLYGGSLAAQACGVFRRAGVPVTEEVVKDLLPKFDLLFDGFSEVKVPLLSDARDELSALVGQASLVVTSRQEALHGPLRNAARQMRLLPVDDNTLLAFLLRYLDGSETKAATLRTVLTKQLRLTRAEWTPLMLAMVTQTYRQTGEVPSKRSEVYGRFYDFLVREETLAGLPPAAVKYALEQLTGKAFLEQGERGYSEDLVLATFAELRPLLKDRYDADVAGSRLLATIEGSGIFLRRARFLTFFHDSFESYVAARYLETRFMQHSTEEIRVVAERRNQSAAFAEAWDFLKDLVAVWGDPLKLCALEQDTKLIG